MPTGFHGSVAVHASSPSRRRSAFRLANSPCAASPGRALPVPDQSIRLVAMPRASPARIRLNERLTKTKILPSRVAFMASLGSGLQVLELTDLAFELLVQLLPAG